MRRQKPTRRTARGKREPSTKMNGTPMYVGAAEPTKKKAPLTRRRNGAFRRGKKPAPRYYRSIRPPSANDVRCFLRTTSLFPNQTASATIVKTPLRSFASHRKYSTHHRRKSQHNTQDFTEILQFQHSENPQASQVTQPSQNRSRLWQSGQSTLYCVCCHCIPEASSLEGTGLPARFWVAELFPVPLFWPLEPARLRPFPSAPIAFRSASGSHSPVRSSLRPNSALARMYFLSARARPSPRLMILPSLVWT